MTVCESFRISVDAGLRKNPAAAEAPGCLPRDPFGHPVNYKSSRKRGAGSMFKWVHNMSDIAFNILALLFIIAIAALIVLWLPPFVNPPQPS